MPVVQVNLDDGWTVKRTGSWSSESRMPWSRCASNPEAIYFIIKDVPADNWGRNGKLLCDK